MIALATSAHKLRAKAQKGAPPLRLRPVPSGVTFPCRLALPSRAVWRYLPVPPSMTAFPKVEGKSQNQKKSGHTAPVRQDFDLNATWHDFARDNFEQGAAPLSLTALYLGRLGSSPSAGLGLTSSGLVRSFVNQVDLELS